MTYEQAEAYIHNLPRFGSQLGLDRMRKLLSLLGDPQEKLSFVHIAGTNGKGSTAQMTASVLEQGGYRTGLFTSPFVTEFRERYQIGGEMIARQELAGLVEELVPLIDRLAGEGQMVTEFELVTAIGMVWFARSRCDIVVLEVGLGGRFDATNVISAPLCAVITTISLDHTAILGDTVEQIAGEKAGIIKENTDVVTYPLQDADALAVLMEKCARTRSRLHQPNPAAICIEELTPFGSRFTLSGREYRLSLAGEQQVYNAATVLAVIEVLRSKGFVLLEAAVRVGLLQAKIPARFEVLCRSPLVILDGAHNLQAMQALAAALTPISRPKTALIGMMADKDYPRAAAAIAAVCDHVVTVPVLGNPRSASEQALAEAVSPHCPDVYPIQDYSAALQRAAMLAGSDGLIVLCGSFYLAGELRRLLREKNFFPHA